MVPLCGFTNSGSKPFRFKVAKMLAARLVVLLLGCNDIKDRHDLRPGK